MAQSLYEAAGGADGMLALARAWHQQCLADPVVSHAFSHPGQHPQHVQRLAAYWAESLGGPVAYSGALGDHAYVLRMHAGNGEHQEMDDRAQACFARALDEAELAADTRLQAALREWFAWMIDAMSAYPRSPDDVPAHVAMPIWSWDGLSGSGR